jgi:hypothetical protein
MKERCTKPNDRFWADYGGRGITVCDEWMDDFERFFADMGPRPSDAHSIDRIDNERGYEPGNCRWALPADQASNRRARKLSTHCPNGHAWTPENTHVYRGARRCRACRRDQERDRRATRGAGA